MRLYRQIGRAERQNRNWMSGMQTRANGITAKCLDSVQNQTSYSPLSEQGGLDFCQPCQPNFSGPAATELMGSERAGHFAAWLCRQRNGLGTHFLGTLIAGPSWFRLVPPGSDELKRHVATVLSCLYRLRLATGA
jgi:hypothetical protein